MHRIPWQELYQGIYKDDKAAHTEKCPRSAVIKLLHIETVCRCHFIAITIVATKTREQKFLVSTEKEGHMFITHENENRKTTAKQFGSFLQRQT